MAKSPGKINIQEMLRDSSRLLMHITPGDAAIILKGYDKVTLGKFKRAFSQDKDKDKYTDFIEIIEQTIVAVENKGKADEEQKVLRNQLKEDLKKIIAKQTVDLRIPKTLDLTNIAGIFNDWSQADLERIHGYLVANKSSKSEAEQERYELLRVAVVGKINAIIQAKNLAAQAAKQKADEEAAAAEKRKTAIQELKAKINAIMAANQFLKIGKQTVSNFTLDNALVGFDLKSLTPDEKIKILADVEADNQGQKIQKFDKKVQDMKNIGVTPPKDLEDLIAKLKAKT